MAGIYIQWCKGLAEKPEVLRMAALLQCNRFEVAGRLMKFWEWTDDVVPEDSIQSGTGSAVIEMSPSAGDNVAFVDALCGLEGFAAAMTQVGWLKPVASGLEVPNFALYNGSTAKTRGRNARNQARRRGKASRDDQTPDHAVTVLSPANGDTCHRKPVTRAEKSREQSAALSEQQTAEAAVLRKLLAAEKFQVADLHNTSRLLALSASLKAAPSAYSDSDNDRLMIVAAAEHVLSEMANRARKAPLRNPCGLYAKLVCDRNWQDITNPQIDSANERIKQFQREQRPPGPALAQSFADKLAAVS